MRNALRMKSRQDRLAKRVPAFRAWFPAAALALLIAAAYLAGAGHYLSLGAIAEHREWLKHFTTQHLLAAILIYMAVYITAVALSLPGAAVMSILGGFLFGWWISVPVTVVAAAIGAVIVFHIVKTSLGATLAERAGPMVRKLSKGFAEDAFSYLLFLRLVPVFPFFMVNAVAGLCSVRLKTFIAATVIGIVPGALAFAYLGTGLDSIIAAQMQAHQACIALNGSTNCRFELDAGALLTPEIMTAFIILGFVGLIPIGLKHWKNRRNQLGP